MRFQKNVLHPELVTKTFKNTTENVLKTMMVPSEKNSKALTNLNDKRLEIKNDRAMVEPHLVISNIANPIYTSHFNLVKTPTSTGVNYLSVNKTIPVTLHDNLLTL